MITHKKAILLVVLFLMGIFTLTACQNSSKNNNDSATNQADSNLQEDNSTNDLTPTQSTEDTNMGETTDDAIVTPTEDIQAEVTKAPELTPVVIEYEESKVPDSLLSIESRVSVHDPSIVFNEANGEYYVFGSHKAWAVSNDLADWNTFTTNVSFDFAEIFSMNGEW